MQPGGSCESVHWEVGLAAGGAYNWWMVRTRSLADCMLAHAAANALLAVYVLVFNQWQHWLLAPGCSFTCSQSYRLWNNIHHQVCAASIKGQKCQSLLTRAWRSSVRVAECGRVSSRRTIGFLAVQALGLRVE